MNRIDLGHPIVQGVDGDEIEQGNDSFIDYVTSGTAAAGVSAVVGTLNSLMGVANLAGASFEYLDETKVVRDTFGSDTAEFYERHKEGIDVAGLVASTIVPGTLAVKALRAAQTSGRVGTGVSVATGLKNGDVVLGSTAVQNARTAIVQQGRYDASISNLFSNEAKRAALAAGFKQNVLEAAVFESVALLSTNQSATLNPEHVNALSSSLNIIKDGWEFMIVGPAIGAVMDTFKIRGYLDRAWKEHEQPIVKSLVADPLSGLSGTLPLGDQATILAKALKSGEALEEGQTALGQELLGAMRRDLDDLIIKGKQDESPATRQFFDDALAHERPEEFLAGMGKVRHMTFDESERGPDFSMKSPAPGLLIETSSGALIQHEWLAAASRALGRELGPTEIDEIQEISDAWFNAIQSQPRNASTYAGPTGMGQARDIMGQEIPFSVRTGAGTEPDKIIQARGIVQIEQEEDLYETFTAIAQPQMKKYGLPQISFEEWRTGIILHELGHTTTNGAKHLRFVEKAFRKATKTSELPVVLKELLELAKARRSGGVQARFELQATSRVATGVAASKDEAYMQLLKEAGEVADENRPYVFNAYELLADAASMIANPRTREWAAKSAPSIAKMMARYGSLAMPWTPTKAYYNTATKKFLTSAVAGVNDLTPNLRLMLQNGKQGINVGGKFTAENDSFFSLEYLRDHLESSGRLDYMDFSKQYAIAGLKKLEDYGVENGGTYAFKSESDIANMERLWVLTKPEDNISYMIGDRALDHAGLRRYVEEYKETMRLTLTSKADVYGSAELGHILNADLGDTYGLEGVDYFMQAKQRWDSPTQVAVEYTKLNPDGVNEMARSLGTIGARTDIHLAANKTAAAEVIGNGYERLPPQIRASLSSLSQADRVGGMLSTARGEFGSLLSELTYIGKVVTDLVAESSQIIEDLFAPWYGKINHVEAKALRAELAVAENFARRQHTRLLRADDGNVLYDERLIAEARALAKEAGTDQWERFLPGLLNDANSIRVTDDIADFVEFHVRENNKYLEKSKKLGEARGHYVGGVADRFYVPPRDLKDERYFAFVVPNIAAEGTENGKYMLFGRTQEELDAKMALIRKREGSRYKIVTRQEVAQYKQLQGEYDKGQVFDELQFDSGMQKIGTSSELIPNMDLQGSTALERFRKYHHNRSEAILRSAVELQYSEHFTQLDMLGRQLGRFEEGKLAFGLVRKERDNVYTKARNLALAIRGHDGPVAYLWKSVNDMVGEKGGAAIDGMMRTFSRKARITEADLNSINQRMEEMGVQMPFKDVAELLISSTDTRVSRTLPTLVRTMNNLSATFMLRLDFMNSIVQTISTPILTSTVLREAMQELSGDRLKALQDVTTVVNPATKLREPTAAKLQMKAVQRFFTEEGKRELAEYTNLGLIPDFLYEFREAMDFSELTGSHTLQKVNDKLDVIGRVGGRVSGHTKAEQFSRFMVIDAMRQLCDIRGITGKERYAIYSSALDKVHGVYRHSQRINLFNGVVGNAIGLYQTYMFNFAQNMVRHLEAGDKKSIAIAAALQGSLFGGRSFPGFQTMNSWIAEANSGREDLYTVSGADDPNSFAAYMMYGLGSHVLGVPVDLFSRGEMSVRNSLVVPTSPGEIPSVSTIARGVGAMINTVKLMSQDNVPAQAAFLHGMAHNGMNRPLQGLATIAMGYVDDKKGVPLFLNTNHVDYDLANELNYGSMFARIIGGKPFDEAVLLDNYYRTKQYQLETREQVQKVSTKINLALSQSREVTPEQWEDFMLDYEQAGGRLENFNAYATRAMSAMSTSSVAKLRMKQEEDSAMRRAYRRMLIETEVPEFQFDSVAEPAQEAQ